MKDIYGGKLWTKNYDSHVQPVLKYEEKTFAEKFKEIAERFPDKTALHYLDNQLTFRELDELSNQLAHYFIKIGLKPDDVVGINMPNIPAHYISIIAVQKAGCISTGLSPLLTSHEMEDQLNDSHAKVIITADILFDKTAEVSRKSEFTSVIVSELADFHHVMKPKMEAKVLPGKTVVRIMDVIKGMPKNYVAVKRGMDDAIFMMYTGGTTGPSKGAVITQRSYMSNRVQLFTWLDITHEHLLMSAFPMFHIAGLAVGGFSLTTGTSQICVPNPRDTDFIINAMNTLKPHGVLNVPTVYFEMMKKPEFKEIDTGNLQWCLSAAAPFPPDYIDELEGIIGKNKFIELYGMTETSPVTCCNPRYGRKKPTSIGMPLPDTEIKLIDPGTGEPAKIGEPGEIVVRGPQLMKGYYNQPEETANAIRNGWMYTGDLATMDDDGYLYLVDRVKDMVIVSGFKVFTRELDDILMKHPDVQLAATFGMPDPARPGSERVGAAIILNPGIEKSNSEKEKIIDYLKENVAPYKVPKVIEFMDQLPMSGVGKILKRELRAMISV